MIEAEKRIREALEKANDASETTGEAEWYREAERDLRETLQNSTSPLIAITRRLATELLAEIDRLTEAVRGQLRTIEALTMGCEERGLHGTTPVIVHMSRMEEEIDRLTRENAQLAEFVEAVGGFWGHTKSVLVGPESLAEAIDRMAEENLRLTRERDEARAERDAMAKDAARYRFLSCKGVPPHSHRWSRWRLEYWNGEWWDPLMKEELDAAIDAQIEKEKANGSR